MLFNGYPKEVVDQVLSHHKLHGGISRVDKIEYIHRVVLGKPLSLEELAAWTARYASLVVDNVLTAPWIAGAMECLLRLPSEWKKFIVSGTPEEELQYIVEQREIGPYFDEIFGSPVKKAEHIRALLRRYGLDTENCIFIGDALTDYNAAKETGLHFIGIHGEIDFPKGTTVLEDCTCLEEAISSILR